MCGGNGLIVMNEKAEKEEAKAQKEDEKAKAKAEKDEKKKEAKEAKAKARAERAAKAKAEKDEKKKEAKEAKAKARAERAAKAKAERAKAKAVKEAMKEKAKADAKAAKAKAKAVKEAEKAAAKAKAKANKNQSAGLSKRHLKMSKDGKHLNDDSKHSEKVLTNAIVEVIIYAEKLFKPLGYEVYLKKKITLYDCQLVFQTKWGTPAAADPKNKRAYMLPDGGCIFVKKQDRIIPILITEDKVQGTNDTLFSKGLPRQGTGNAIERCAKNLRGAQMLFCNQNIFPYVIFGSGCDFHHSGTISKRIDMLDFGFPPHYIPITPSSTPESTLEQIETIVNDIDIRKKYGIYDVASVFLKAHKWDEMPHGSSRWTKDEIAIICKKVIDQVFISLTKDT